MKTPTWSADEDAVIASVLAGNMTFFDMFELLAHRSPRDLRRRYAGFGKPEPDERHARAMTIGSGALLLALTRERRCYVQN